MQGKAHLPVGESGRSPSGRAWGRGEQWGHQCPQSKVFAKAGSQWGSPWSFQETVAQLTPGHYNKHRKNKIIKQEKEQKNEEARSDAESLALGNCVHFPRSLLETGKHFPALCQGLLSNFLQSASSLSCADCRKKVKPRCTWRSPQQKGPFCCPKIKVLGSGERIEVYWFSIDETMTTAWRGEITPLSSENIVSHPRLTVEVDK